MTYEPRTWHDGDRPTGTDMTRIEQGIADAGSSSDAAVAGFVADTGSASYDAVQSAALAKIQAWQSPYSVKATDYGVQVGSDSDQSGKLQDALDAAAATGADLLLPTGVIRLDGQFDWYCHKHSIIGQQGTVLDCTHGTFDGAVFSLRGDRLTDSPPDLVVATSRFSKIVMRGPNAASTTVDGIRVEGHAGGSGTSVYGVTFEQVAFTGFRHQEVFGNFAWLVRHNGVYYNESISDAILYEGTTTTGENISWDHCSFANNNAAAFNAPNNGSGIDAYFTYCSFDFNSGPALKAKTGVYGFDACHFEWGGIEQGSVQWADAPNLMELASDTTSTRTPVVRLSGGEALLQGQYVGAAEYLDVAIVQTNTSQGRPPIVVQGDGLTIRNFATGAFLTFHREIGSPGQLTQHVTYHGHLSLRSPMYSYARAGRALSLIVDGRFGTSVASGIPGYDKVGKWGADPTYSTVDVVKHPNFKSVKIIGGAPSWTLAQNVIVAGVRFLHVSLLCRGDSYSAGTRDGIWMHFWDNAGNQVAFVKATADYPNSAEDHWSLLAGYTQVPPTAMYATVEPRTDGSTGTLWVTDVQVCPT